MSSPIAEPPPRLCAPRGAVRPHAAICGAAITHAAYDGTQLFLSLLPVDLRAVVDRLHRSVAWHHAGELVSVPDVNITSTTNAARVLSPEGEEVILVSDFTMTHIIRIDLPLDHPRRAITVPGLLEEQSVVDEPGLPPLLLTTVHGARKSMWERPYPVRAILSDLNGNVIKTWEAPPGNAVAVLSHGWVATNLHERFATPATELFYAHAPAVSYTLPPAALPDCLSSAVEVFDNFGTPKAFIESWFPKGSIRLRLSLWDLKTGALHYSLEFGKSIVKLFPRLGVMAITAIVVINAEGHSTAGDTEIRSLTSGAVLCVDKSRGADEELNDHTLLLGGFNSVFNVWNRDHPTAISSIDFSDWRTRCDHGVIAASRGPEFVLYQIGAGRVVRTDMEPSLDIPFGRGILHTDDAVLLRCRKRNVLYVTSLTETAVSDVASVVSMADHAAAFPSVHSRALGTAPGELRSFLMPIRAPYGVEPMFITNDGKLLRMRAV